MSHCEQCTLDPWLNLSSEDPDHDRSIAINHFVNRPPLGSTWRSNGCLRICVSEVSQDEADDCALLQATLCVLVDQPTPPVNPEPPFQPPNLFVNDEQTCTIRCSDGRETSSTGEGTFSWTQPAGTVVALSQLEANTLANSLACARARQHRICINRNLAGGCVNEAYRQQIRAVGGTPAVWPFVGFLPPLGCSADVVAGDRSSNFAPIPYTWSLIAGTLPPGLELRPCTGYIKGTPTTTGTYFFTVRATDAIGSFQNQSFNLTIAQISTEDPLPDMVLGEDYVVSLTVDPAHDQETESWSVIDGELPPGLELSSVGILSGVPEGEVVGYQFTVQVTFIPNGSSSFLQCTKEFHVSVSSSVNFYWSFEGDSLIDVIQDTPIIDIGNLSNQEFVAGFFDKAVRVKPNTTSTFKTWGYGTGILEELTYSNDGILMATWVKVNAANALNFQTYLDYRQYDALDTEVGGLYCLGRANGFLGCFHYNINGFNNSELPFLASAGGPVSIGAWYLLVMYLDSATNIVHVLVDNVEIGTIAALAPVPNPKGSFVFKNANGGASETGDFTIDEWTILINAIITDGAKATYLWNGGTGRQCPCSFP